MADPIIAVGKSAVGIRNDVNALQSRSRVLASIAATGQMRGIGGAAPFYTRAVVPIPVGTIKGGDVLDLWYLFNRPLAGAAGAAMRWRLRNADGSGTPVTMVQNNIGATIRGGAVQTRLMFSPDLKCAFEFSLNGLDQASLTTAGVYAATGIKASNLAAQGTRNRTSSGSMPTFTSYSTSPTVETLLVDFTKDLELYLEMLALNGDTVECIGASVTLHCSSISDIPVNYAPSKTISAWGDSLTEGVGSTSNLDWVNALLTTRAGWSIDQCGLGGQTTAQIAARITGDAVRGKQWKAIIWAGTNDVVNTNGGLDWWNAVYPHLDAVLAYRTSTETIICNLHPASTWAVGDANYVAMQYVNAQLATRYGTRVCDLFTALATDAGKVPAGSMADTIHLNNTGYATVAATVDAKMTSLGWS